MGTRTTIPVTGPAYKNPSIPANNQRCVNMYPTTPGPNNALEANNPMEKGRGTGPLLRTIGSKFLTNLGTSGVCRGIWNVILNTSTYLTVCVIANRVYKLTFDKTNLTLSAVQLTGTLSNSTGPVIMTYNNVAMMFTNSNATGSSTAGSYWAYNIDNTLNQIIDADWDKSSHVVMIDGYFLINNPSSPTLQSSQLNNPSDWDALKIAQANSNPDYLVGVGATKGELWAFGSQSIEVWYDAANAAGFPFSKRVGSDIDVGCAAPYSIQLVNGNLIWLDSRRFLAQSDYSQFFRNQSSGYQITKLSNEAVDNAWASYSTVADAIGSTYNDHGHIMYEITFPTANKTWVYDTTLQMWHERSYFNQTNGTYNASRTNYYAQYDQYILAGCNNSNSIYVMSRDFLTDAGEPIHRIRSTQHFAQDGNEICVNEIELKCNTGVAPSGLNIEYSKAFDSTLSVINSDTGLSASITKIELDIVTFVGSRYEQFILYGSVLNGDGTYSIYADTTFPTLIAGDVIALSATTLPTAPGGFVPVYPALVVSSVNYIDPITLQTFKLITVSNLVGFPNLSFTSFGVQGNIILDTIPGYGSWGSNTLKYTAPLNFLGLDGSAMAFTLFDASVYNGTMGLGQNGYFYLTSGKPPPAVGNTFALTATSYVTSVELVSTLPAFIGDYIYITRNDASVAIMQITQVVGSVYTVVFIEMLVSDPTVTRLLTSTVTVGNEADVYRQAPIPNIPKINLRYSNDSGYTWSNTMTRDLGATGQFNKRLIWGPLGSSREWLLEFKISDVTDVSIVDASAVIDVESIA